MTGRIGDFKAAASAPKVAEEREVESDFDQVEEEVRTRQQEEREPLDEPLIELEGEEVEPCYHPY